MSRIKKEICDAREHEMIIYIFVSLDDDISSNIAKCIICSSAANNLYHRSLGNLPSRIPFNNVYRSILNP